MTIFYAPHYTVRESPVEPEDIEDIPDDARALLAELSDDYGEDVNIVHYYGSDYLLLGSFSTMGDSSYDVANIRAAEADELGSVEYIWGYSASWVFDLAHDPIDDDTALLIHEALSILRDHYILDEGEVVKVEDEWWEEYVEPEIEAYPLSEDQRNTVREHLWEGADGIWTPSEGYLDTQDLRDYIRETFGVERTDD